MNRSELAVAIANHAGLSVADADRALVALVDTIGREVAAGQTVALAGFGTFERRHRAARTGRNPQTGEALEIPETLVPAFKPAAAFKRLVAGA